MQNIRLVVVGGLVLAGDIGGMVADSSSSVKRQRRRGDGNAMDAHAVIVERIVSDLADLHDAVHDVELQIVHAAAVLGKVGGQVGAAGIVSVQWNGTFSN